MIKRTHLAIGLSLGLYFQPFLSNDVLKLYFIPIILITSLLPDIDSGTSTAGRKKIFKPIQLFLKHRGPLHSYTVCIAASVALAFFYPIFALPFFLGYSFHLLTDSFTIRGIKPFWPLKLVSKGVVKTGGLTDRTIFYTFIITDVFLLVLLFV